MSRAKRVKKVRKFYKSEDVTICPKNFCMASEMPEKSTGPIYISKGVEKIDISKKFVS